MAKSKAKERSDDLFQHLEQMAQPESADGDEDTASLVALQGRQILSVVDSSRFPRMKKFRFQLLHQWLVGNFEPCRAADIGGGKGLLAFLLQESGWDTTVIDPVDQPLPDKYKDLRTGARVKIKPDARVTRINEEFEPGQAAGFDLLIGMHAHACNVKIIDAAAKYGCSFVIFPCCVIGEPFYPPLGVHWLESLADYALRQGHTIQPFRLNFKGQNIGLVSPGIPDEAGLLEWKRQRLSKFLSPVVNSSGKLISDLISEMRD